MSVEHKEPAIPNAFDGIAATRESPSPKRAGRMSLI